MWKFWRWPVDQWIIVSTTLAVFGEVVINFITSYGHISILGFKYGENGLDADLTPVGIDLFLFAFAMLNLYLARKGRYVETRKRRGRVKRKPEFPWVRWVLAAGVSATVAANLAYGAHWGRTGALIAAFSAAAMFFTVEAGMLMLRVAAEEAEKKAAEVKAEPVYLKSQFPGFPDIPTIGMQVHAKDWIEDLAASDPTPSEGIPVPEPEGKAPNPGINLTGWRELNGQKG